MYVSQMVATVFCALSEFDISVIMPMGTSGSGTASSNISLLDRLGLSRQAILRLLGRGVVASSGQEDAICLGQLSAIQTAFERMTVNYWACTNTSFNVMRGCRHMTLQSLSSFRHLHVISRSRVVISLEPPRPARPFYIAHRLPHFLILRLFMETREDAVCVVRARYIDACEHPGGGSISPKRLRSEQPCYGF